MNSSVPTEWITDELARFCDIVGGGTPDRAVHEYWGGQIPWVSPTEVTSLVSKYISKTKDSLYNLLYETKYYWHRLWCEPANINPVDLENFSYLSFQKLMLL